ncbi:MAG: HDOD domain-containing protein [Aestuariibacter sp.]
MKEKQDIRIEIDYRFYHLIMRLDKGQEAAGVEVEGKIKAEQSEQFNARRKLLKIEEKVQKEKQDEVRTEQSYLNEVSRKLHEEVLRRIEDEIEDIDRLNLKMLQLTPEITEILDMMSLRAVSMMRLEPIVGSVDWLAGEILSLVNNSSHRKKDRLGRVNRVDSVRMALSFLGIENLKLVVPSILFKNMLPKHMDNYPFFKNKVWEHAMASALSCKEIAALSDVDEYQAYIIGMLHEVGKLAIAKMYFRHFEEAHQDALVSAHEEMRRDEHMALLKVEASTDYWFTAMWRYSIPLSGRILEHMDFKRLQVAEPMAEYAAKLEFQNLSPLARVLLQGDGYAKYRVLKNYKLINMEDAKEYLKTFRMPKGSLANLKTKDLEKLPLVDV